MEGRLWMIVLNLLPQEHRTNRQVYSDRTILMVGLWATLHDRPFCWACDEQNWLAQWRPARLPHPSTLSRRWQSCSLTQAAKDVYENALQRLSSTTDAAIDGKPLIVSDVSKDPEAKNGRGTRGMARGYKLHAVVDGHGVVRAFEVCPLNVNERKPAGRLLPGLPRPIRRVVADGNYDSSVLHRSLEDTHVRLYTPIMRNYAGPRTHPRRHLLLRLMRHPIGKRFHHKRDTIERTFARLGNIGFGFKGLPNWVRRLHRVTRWIWGKIMIYHAWLIAQRGAS